MPAKDNFALQLDLTDFSEAPFVIKLGDSVANQTQYILSLKNSKRVLLYKEGKKCEKENSTVYRVA